MNEMYRLLLIFTIELYDLRRLWRRQGVDTDQQPFNYLTRIPLSQFLYATGAQGGNFGKFKRMPVFNTFGKNTDFLLLFS